jgi:hypothetical protein
MKTVAFGLFVVVCAPLWTPDARADGGGGHGESHFVAPEDGALVVFVRRRFLQKLTRSFVLDEQERCIAATRGKTHTKVVMEPGRHSVFAFFRKNGRWVDLELQAGRTYVVRTRPNGLYRTQLEIYPAVRGEATFAESKEWLADTKHYQPDLAAMTRQLQKKRWRRRYAAALAEGNEMRDTIADYADRFTVQPEDGRTREEATELEGGN